MDNTKINLLKDLLRLAIQKIDVELKQIKELNAKRELFCQLFASDREFFGNGVQAYIEAYNVDLTKKGAYAMARAAASRLLTNVNVLKRIDELLETAVLNDEFVDKQLSLVIAQHADFSAKMSAIKEYNSLKQRITKKLDVTSGGKPIPILGGMSVQDDHSSPEDSQPPQTN